MKRLLTLIPLFIFMAACNQATAPVDPSVISSNSEKWQAAMNAKDVDAIAALYADDARLMPPNGKASIGLDGVRAAFGGMIDAGLSIELTSIDADVSGDIGINIGTYVLMAGESITDQGKFIETWKRGSDDTWHIANDIWNSDLPVAAPSARHPHLLVVHEVEDGDHWMEAWRGPGSRHALFETNGAAHVHTFRSAENPNLTGLVIAVKDADALNALFESEEGQAAAAEDGVDLANTTVLRETE